MRRPLFLAALLAATSSSRPAHAAWPNSPFVNLPVSTATSDQASPTMVSDGAGGAIVTWADYRADGVNPDIYAQHIRANGTVDPAWPANGRALCTAAGEQSFPFLVSDGAGGALVCFRDRRSGTSFDIYVQHVWASGIVNPMWPADGRAVCTAAGDQTDARIVSDGAGGAIITWTDPRTMVNDIYAQHVLPFAIDPAWPANGRALCTATGSQDLPQIISDGAGGAIVTWADQRAGVSNVDIYAQRVLSSGAVDPAWPADGRAICTAANSQGAPVLVSDGAGGAMVAWYDLRGGGVQADLYATHLLFSGQVDPNIPTNGRAVTAATGNQDISQMVSDGAGGAVVAWRDFRNGANYDIYAQHVQASGLMDAAWPADGRALCTQSGEQSAVAIVADGFGGAIVAWHDTRSAISYDIYAQHVLAAGAVDPSWPTDGRALCTANGTQMFCAALPDGAGGAIVAWTDSRAGFSDIMAQRVARFGYLGTPEGEIASARDVPNDNGGKVKLAWNTSYLDLNQDANLAAYDVYRSVPPNTAAALRASGKLRALADVDVTRLRAGDIVAIPNVATAYAWEFVQTVSPNHFASQYSVQVATPGDSLGASNPKTAFLVNARNSSGSMFWPSQPDSGYSVDNLPPVAPAPFLGTYGGGTSQLHWSPNSEVDLANYRLYRGASSGFTPSPGNQIATPVDTLFSDVGVGLSWYKLSAVDAHGNESGFTTLLPTSTSGVDESGARGLALAPPSPNPSWEAMTLRYSLPRASEVSLDVFDSAGRRVRRLVSGTVPAGDHTAIWNLLDDRGGRVGAGLYFVRLESAGRRLIQRAATLR